MYMNRYRDRLLKCILQFLEMMRPCRDENLGMELRSCENLEAQTNSFSFGHCFLRSLLIRTQYFVISIDKDDNWVALHFEEFFDGSFQKICKLFSIRHRFVRVLPILRVFFENFLWDAVHLIEEVTKQDSDYTLGGLRSIGMTEEEVYDSEPRCL